MEKRLENTQLNREKPTTDTQAPKKKRRLLTLLFVAVNVIVIAWTAISEIRRGRGAVDFRSIKIRWAYLIPAVLCVVAAIAAEVSKYAAVMKARLGRADWTLCRRDVLLGRYYDNITPSGIGGQPYQIYYLRKHGLPAAEAAAIPIAGFLSMQFSFIILAILCAILGRGTIHSGTLRVTSYIGIVMYSLFPAAILMFTFFPRFSEKMTRLLVALLAKLRLVKDREKTANRFVENVQSYSASLRQLINKLHLTILVMALGLIYQACLMCVPYFVIRAFGGQIGFWQCFVTVVTIYAAITFIPTPGNAGAAEGVFYAVFSVLGGGRVFWAMPIWRFLVYYIYLIYGIVYNLFEARFEAKRRRG